MSLSELEQKAGRIFRAGRQSALDDRNATVPPGGEADPLHRVDRHACPAQGGASVGIELTEHREASPLYWVCYCSLVAEYIQYVFPHEDCQGGVPAAGAGLLTFVWKDGRCPDCGLVLRSSRGRVALTADLQPLKERKVAQDVP
jgi:hypothetical protein